MTDFFTVFTAQTTFNVTSILVNHNFFVTYSRIDTKISLTEDDQPDIELILSVTSLTNDISGGFRGLVGLTDEFYKEVYKSYEGTDAFSIVPVLLQPKSRGRLKLRSSNPFHWPVLDINYYSHEDDVNTMIRGIKKVITSVEYLTVSSIHYSLFIDH